MELKEQKVKKIYSKKVEITREDILELVHKKMGGMIGIDITKPMKDDKIEVFVKVPGGGDWSNTNLDIDENNPIVVDVQYTD